MKGKLNIALTVLSLLAYSYSWAQDYKQDMLKIREYYKTQYHSFRMKFAFCPFDSLSMVADSMNGKCSVTGSSYYYKFSGGGNEYEYVKNSNHYLVIDHGNKVLALQESSKARIELWDMRKIDSLMSSSYMKVSYKDIGKDEGEYTLSFLKGTWNRLSILFNKTNYTLNKITLCSAEKGIMSGVKFNKPRISISYSDYSTAEPDNTVFSDARYITTAGSKVMPTESYKGYKVLDYIK
jgi:hypothetical protein